MEMGLVLIIWDYLLKKSTNSASIIWELFCKLFEIVESDWFGQSPGKLENNICWIFLFICWIIAIFLWIICQWFQMICALLRLFVGGGIV